MKINENQIFKQTVEKWGEESQIGMLHEEIGELLQAVNKFKRESNETNFHNVCEEIADVKIMLEQISVITDAHLVNSYYQKKLLRLKNRLKNN